MITTIKAVNVFHPAYSYHGVCVWYMRVENTRLDPHSKCPVYNAALLTRGTTLYSRPPKLRGGDLLERVPSHRFCLQGVLLPSCPPHLCPSGAAAVVFIYVFSIARTLWYESCSEHSVCHTGWNESPYSPFGTWQMNLMNMLLSKRWNKNDWTAITIMEIYILYCA